MEISERRPKTLLMTRTAHDDQHRGRLLRRYARRREPADLEQLVVAYGPLARGLARRYSAGSAGPEDLEQVAYEGLIKAIERYDPDRGSAFTSFAVPTVLGELRRYLRDTAWPAHVPRRLQERVREVREAAAQLATARGRPPTADDLAADLGYDLEDVLEALEVSVSLNMARFDAPAPDPDGTATAAERIGDEDPAYETVECMTAIEQSLPALTIGERQALRLHFGEALTHRELAQRLGVSRSQAIRDLKSAISRLQEMQFA